jgi:hypothetical protein
MNKYFSQKASSWVTLTVLAGGMVVAVTLFFVVKLDKEFQFANSANQLQFESL